MIQSGDGNTRTLPHTHIHSTSLFPSWIVNCASVNLGDILCAILRDYLVGLEPVVAPQNMATIPREGVSDCVCGPEPCHFLDTFCNVLSLIEYER